MPCIREPRSPTQKASAYEELEQQAQAKPRTWPRSFGLPGLDDASNRAFAAKLMKYAGWRSVTYRGKGVFDVDYHFDGRATQDFLFPALPDNDLIIPFIAIRRRADGSVLVTAPALTGGPDRSQRAPGAAARRHERRAGVARARAASPSSPTARS